MLLYRPKSKWKASQSNAHMVVEEGAAATEAWWANISEDVTLLMS